MVELGAGSAAKTRVILDAVRDEGIAATYVPVDINADFLAATAEQLRHEYPGLGVVPLPTDFTRALPLPADLPRPVLLGFLGSTIGNFPPDQAEALLRRIRAVLRPGDRFLLGVDLRKDRETLERAYNDDRGVTAAFNLNMLRVLQRDFGAELDASAFRHRAHYDPTKHRIEMHLVATRAQRIVIPGIADFTIDEGESIRTEISGKHDRASVEALLAAAGLALDEWRPGADGLFALALAGVRPARLPGPIPVP